MFYFIAATTLLFTYYIAVIIKEQSKPALIPIRVEDEQHPGRE